MTRAVAIVQLTCFNGISCAGSFRLTKSETHVLKRGKRKVHVEVTQNLGSCSEGVLNGGTAQVRMSLTKVGENVMTNAKGRPISAQLLYFRKSGTPGKTVVNVILRRS